MTEGLAPAILKAHVALNVGDVAKSIEFYRRMLGIEPLKVRPGYAKFDVQNPPLNLSLNQSVAPQPGTLSHLGLQVGTTDDVLSIRNQWAAQGLLPRDEMQTSCCYALQDKAWVRDPDGNEWEVFAVLENVEQNNACCQPQAEQLVKIGL